MARPKKVKKKSETKEKDLPVSVTFFIGADIYTAQGETVFDALKKIKPKKYMGITKIQATVNGKTSYLPLKLAPIRMKQLFERPIYMELLAKRLKILL